MEQLARVVLAFDASEVLEEILHHLDRSGIARVVGAASDGAQLAAASRQLDPDVVVAEPSLAAGVSLAAPLVAVATRETVSALRAAIGAGAHGFVVWPGEREDLLGHIQRFAAARRVPERRATVVAVHAARGGVGCTFLATHLAQAFVVDGSSCALIDADPVSGDVAAALGLPEDTTGVNTIADVARALDGLDPDRLPEVLWTHPAGFHVLPAPAPSSVPDVDEGAVRRVVEAVAAGVDVVVVHVGHGSGRIARWCLGHADRVLEVLTLDVLAFRATSRALALLADVNVSDKLALVVNRARRGQLTAGDVRRVFERSPIGVIPFDASVERRQENGALVGSRTRIGRVVARIADRTVEHAVEGVA